MIRFVADIDGIEVLDRKFNRVEQIDDLRPIWPEVIKEFYDIETVQFETEGAAGGAKWAPLSKVYEEYKKIHFPGKLILTATGDLRDSLTDPEALDAILQPRKDELVIGSKVPYAIWHQRGTGRMPARPPINFNETQKRRIQKAIQVGLVQFLRQAGIEVEAERAA